jgi:hypothetical protein
VGHPIQNFTAFRDRVAALPEDPDEAITTPCRLHCG